MAFFTDTNSLNIPKILRAVWQNKGISRIELSRLLEIDKSTVTLIVSKLLESGIIETIAEGKAGATGGRKPVHLAINKNFGVILGVEIQPYSSYKLAVTNLEGELVRSEIRNEVFTSENLASKIIEITNSIQEEIEAPIISVGIGISGIIDSVNGIIRRSIPLDITSDFNVYEEFEKHSFSIPVFIENDANCCAWGELALNRDEKLRNYLVLLIEFRKDEILNTGKGGIAVGLGIAIDRKVYSGSDHTAGEFKSIFTAPGSLNQFSLTKDETVNIMNDKSVFLKFISELSKNAALLVNTFNMDHLFFGGTETDFQDEIIPVMEAAIKDNWMYSEQPECSISEFSKKEFSVAYGASGLILEHLFSIPPQTIAPDQNQSTRQNIISSIESIVDARGEAE